MTGLASSPLPAPALTPQQQLGADKLDDEIATARAEIAALAKRQSLLSSTLLTSTKLQSRLRQHYSSDEEITSLLDQQSIRAKTSAHRLAFGITSFPFIDPSPDTSNRRLLGIRFDICKRNGEFESPYYILLRRIEHTDTVESEVSKEYRIHRHTIPALVPSQQYEESHLPVSDEGYGSEDSVFGHGQSKQNLMAFATSVRNDLTSWHMRKEAIELCQEGLKDDEQQAGIADDDDKELKFGVQCIEAVAVDAYYIRIVWRNGRVGRLKIGDDGTIQKAIVFGTGDGEERRCQSVERMLLGGSGRVDAMVQQLEEVHRNMTS